MTKVVIGRLVGAKRKARLKDTSVIEKRVHDAEGRMKRLLSVDMGNPTFGSDLQYVFGRNVAKARRENTQIIGTPDVVVQKR